MNLGKAAAALILAFTAAVPAFAGDPAGYAIDDLLKAAPSSYSPQTLPAPAKPSQPVRKHEGRNITPEYRSVFQTIHSTFGTKRNKLSAYRILFVAGFGSDNSINPDWYASANKGLFAKSTYFDEQVKCLRDNALDAGIVRIESEAGIKDNARAVAAEIERSPKPVILIAHSKGGLDALEALIERPDLRRKVRGVITIQTPFLGTPLSDMVLKSPTLSDIVGRILRYKGGSMDSLVDISVKGREAYQAANAADIAEITASIPFISFGSWKERHHDALDLVPASLLFVMVPSLAITHAIYTLDTFRAPTRNILDRQGLPNDGLVPVKSAALPGSDWIAVEGVDHLASVRSAPIPPFDRTGFIKTLLTLLAAKGI